jgi:hypothetical protein
MDNNRLKLAAATHIYQKKKMTKAMVANPLLLKEGRIQR